MNRRNRSAARKIEVAPKVPAAPQAVQEAVHDTPIERAEEETMVQGMKGLFAPKSFTVPKPFNFQKDGFVLLLPDSFTEPDASLSLVLFSDGTLGLKWNGSLVECSSTFIGAAMTVELREAVKKKGDVNFIITGFGTEGAF